MLLFAYRCPARNPSMQYHFDDNAKPKLPMILDAHTRTGEKGSYGIFINRMSFTRHR